MLATVATAFMAQYEARQRAQAKETRSAVYSPATTAADANEAGKQGETVVTIPGPPAGFVKA